MAAFNSNDAVVSELLRKVQVFVYPRRIRMRELFVDFDALRCGRCTVNNFSRALDKSGLKMEEHEVEILAEHFEQVGPKVEKPAIFNYVKFCEAVDEVFDAGGPGAMVSSSPSSTQLMTFVPKSIDEESETYHLLHRVATLCKTRGMVVKYIYTDLDRAAIASPSRVNPRRGGKVTRSQFIRFWPFKKEFTEEDVERLAEHYTTESGDVHFQALHNDVTAVMDHHMPPYPRSDLFLKPDDTEWSQHRLSPVEKIRAKVVEKRTRLFEHFQDFDPLRKGHCTCGQVKTVLTLMGLAKDIDKAEFEELCIAYMRDDGLFCYKDFVADCDTAFAIPNLEKDPLAMTSMPDPSCTLPARRNKMSVTSERMDLVSRVEDKIRKRVRTQRMLLKPAFVDMDRARRGYITRNQFARVMNGFQFGLDEVDVGLLCGVYCNLGNHTDFNYCDFNAAVDPPDEDEAVAMQQLSAPYQEKLPQKYFDDRGRIIPASP
mmetsp:Transcript_21402/g.44027  ORF Transcript_21402/g.44027 Transcript_21402/m.44027 type:complete len:486 (-) Transcript_21402:57-1514(-)